MAYEVSDAVPDSPVGRAYRVDVFLVVEHLYPSNTFDIEDFERDYKASWYLDATLDPGNVDARTQLALIESKLTDPKRYLVSISDD